MRTRFDEQLSLLNRELIEMGALCEQAIALAAQALLTGDTKLAGEVPPLEDEIDRKERDIESLCLKLLLQQQPVARDLRLISAALRMITDMERIGDQAADIAEIMNVSSVGATSDPGHIGDMARATIKMVTDSVESFVRKDLDMAQAVIADDDIVDGLFDQVKAALTTRFQDGGDMEYALDLLMIAKYFERIGDHAVNIAEWVLYSITGSKEEAK